MTVSQYWLAQWLDDNEISSEWEIDHVLHSADGVRGLYNAIQKAALDIDDREFQLPERGELGDSIVAGRRLDLSGTLSCSFYDCLRTTIDSTFKRIWHYFDQIVVEGISPRPLAETFKNPDAMSNSAVLPKIQEQARLILYLREIGADRFVVFSHKTYAFCHDHWLQHARELGIAAAVDESRRRKVVEKILKTSNFTIEQHGSNVWAIRVTGRSFDEPYIALYQGTSAAFEPTQEVVANQILADYATAMISDVQLSRRLALPLVEPVSVPGIPGRTNGKTSIKEAQSAVRFTLPVFDRLTTRDFIKIREDERPAFEVCRAALRTAIQNRLTEDPDASTEEIARAIEEDYIRPELANIERRLRNNRAALIKKTAIDLSIGAAVASVGAIATVPLLITGGLGALGSGVSLAPVIHKYIDDSASVKMSDVYFLWRVGKQAEHR